MHKIFGTPGFAAVLIATAALLVAPPPEAEAKDNRAAATSAAPPLPKLPWHKRKGSDEWTRAALAALETEGAALLSTVPADVAEFCPRYGALNLTERKHFWLGFLASVAKHESSWNPGAKGAGGRYLGLMQIAPRTARNYRCQGSMLDGRANMACAVRIAARNIGRDRAIARGQGKGWRGAARDWMPLRSGKKRANIAAWGMAQPFCAP